MTPTALVPLRGGPVLAVKIDNTPSARPRIGLNQADVVYVEPVEGGLTLLAVFSSHVPAEVGPVRSARESDVELLANYGKVALAYSGGSAYTVRVLPRATSQPQQRRPRVGFHRDSSRPAPYNVIGETKTLLPEPAAARAQGHRVPLRPCLAGGVAATSVAARWPASRVTLAWNAGRKQYLVTTDGKPDLGADTVQHGASTVVVQYVRTHMSGNRDVKRQTHPGGRADRLGKGDGAARRQGLAGDVGAQERHRADDPGLTRKADRARPGRARLGAPHRARPERAGRDDRSQCRCWPTPRTGREPGTVGSVSLVPAADPDGRPPPTAG